MYLFLFKLYILTFLNVFVDLIPQKNPSRINEKDLKNYIMK